MFPLNFKKKKKWAEEVETYEIFLDAQNLPKFNAQQMEGRIEKPIAKSSLILLSVFFLLIGLVFVGRVGLLQIAKGKAYSSLSERNTLDQELIFAERGLVYDRNNVPLIWNEENTSGDFARRAYIKSPGFGHILGFVGYPAKDQSGYYWQEEFVGKDGIEKEFNDQLKGENGLKIFEVNVKGEVQSENVIEPPTYGDSLNLSIDSKVQTKLYEYLREFSSNYSFEGGSGVIMDVANGELLALVNYPEYDSEIMSSKLDQEAIKGYLADKRKPFLNRAVSGLYTPGSIVKPFVAIAALNEKIIDPLKKILSIGYIEIPNPYFPEKKSVFKDWKAHGWIDMRQALAQSSDVYFYEVGGGFDEQRGLGIGNINKYSKLFGLDEETGIDLPAENFGTIPTPEWKQIHFPDDPWRIGDTYNTAIGQYGFQVTLLEMTRAAASIANSGLIFSPHLLVNESYAPTPTRKLDIPEEYFQIVREGMRQAVTEGTASRLNLPFVKVAAKTGTAQLGLAKDRVNSWVIGLFPYDNPRYAFTVMMENGPVTNTVSTSLVMNQLLTWMNGNTPEYLK